LTHFSTFATAQGGTAKELKVCWATKNQNNMLKFFKRKNTETDEQRAIRFADIMVAHTDCLGKINKWCLNIFPTIDQEEAMPIALQKIRQELTEARPIINGDLEPFKKWINKNFDDVKLHLLNNGYIDEPKPVTQEWILNGVGKKMKQLKGHKNYREYIDKKHKAEIAEMNGKIHWLRRVIITAIVAAAVGYFLRYLTEPKEKISTDQSATAGKSLSTPATQSEKNVP
jgi:hypothetical protein